MNALRHGFRRALEAVTRRHDPIARSATAMLLLLRWTWRLVFGACSRTRNRIGAFLGRPSVRFARHVAGALRDAMRGSSASAAAGWTESNLQHALNFTTARLQRARRPVLRAVCLLSGALQKYRERAYAESVDAAMILDRPLDQRALRNFAAFQYGIRQDPAIPPTAKVNLALRIADDVKDARINDLFSAFCSAATFGDLVIHWDAAAAHAAEGQILTLAELRARDEGRLPRAPLSAMNQDMIEKAEHFGVPDAFIPHNDGRRSANAYLKAAFDWRFVIAVSLREDEAGAIDDELALWEPVLLGLRDEFPSVRVCMLNRAPRGRTLDRIGSRTIPFACEGGLSMLDSVALTRQANAYFGVLDFYGLAARSAQIPGVYLPLGYQLAGLNDPLGDPLGDPENGPLWRMDYPSIETVRAALRHVVLAGGAAELERLYGA
jgi:hypothetical protein